MRLISMLAGADRFQIAIERAMFRVCRFNRKRPCQPALKGIAKVLFGLFEGIGIPTQAFTDGRIGHY